MSLVDHLLATRTALELAKELAQTAKENAHLREQVARLECEVFWLKVDIGGTGCAAGLANNHSRNGPDGYVVIEW
jgi:hypothetical protein